MKPSQALSEPLAFELCRNLMTPALLKSLNTGCCSCS